MEKQVLILLEFMKPSHLAKVSIFVKQFLEVSFCQWWGLPLILKSDTICEGVDTETFEKVRYIREDVNLPTSFLWVRKGETSSENLNNNKHEFY